MNKQQIATIEVGKLNSKRVHCPELNKDFESTHEAERLLGIDNGNISRCCRGKRKSAGKHPDNPKIKLTQKYYPENIIQV